METNNKSIENFNELVFENRHKEYGAYAIRKSYTDNVTQALFVTSTFFGLLALLGVLLTNNKVTLPDISILNEPPPLFKQVEINLLPEAKKTEIKKIEKTEAPPKANSGPPEVTDDKKQLLDKPAEKLAFSNNPNPGVDSAAKKTDSPEVPAEAPAEKSNGIVKVPDHMPELENMREFIADHLKYPRNAVEGNIEGTVYVSFVVEIDGSVSNIELIRGIGNGCEQEAIRVIKTFPKWKPGIYEGKPVRTQCNLPISFRLKN